MMRPVGIVIFQVQLLLAEKLFGKLGLEKNPLDPLRMSPGGTHAAREVNIFNQIVKGIGRVILREMEVETR